VLDRFRPLANRLLSPWVRAAAAIGLTPNGVSVIAFGFALAAGGSFLAVDADGSLGGSAVWYLVGSLCVFLNGWLDLVDGSLARELGTDSRGGDLLDHVLDRYADLAIVGGLAAGADAYALGLLAITGVLMTSYLGTQIQAVGLGRAYGGLLGRADRLALVGVVGIVAYFVPGAVAGTFTVVELLLVLFALVGHFTALQRFWGAWTDLT
jgi:archaetidylinositol phosphate synthase